MLPNCVNEKNTLGIQNTQYSIELSIHKQPSVFNTTYPLQSQLNCPIEGQVLIQDDINYLTSWCSTNLIELNVKKRKYICFTGSSPNNGFYTMNVTALQLVNSFNSLGIIFNCKFSFRNHITLIVNKATCILRFIKR